MSVIGPRPQLVRDMVFMTDEQRIRHTAKPGLSGLAQVNGRNAISWEDKIDWDLKYIEKVSLGLFLNAEFIFTNSFHGTAFAINFNKQFNVELPPARIQASSRVKDILRIFDLEKQVIEKGEIKSNIIKYELH